MSGIHGLFRFDGSEVAARDLERQARALSHRGRDRSDTWRDGPVGLGHLLLRITAEDNYDAQPLYDRETGVALVADIRLDNRESLAADLSVDPAALAELPDSALVLHAYKRWGEDCASHLLGDFVFAIWDSRLRKLVLARDHLGQRSLFFYRGDGFFAFASEPHGLWALPDVPRTLDPMEMGARIVLDLAPKRGKTRFKGLLYLQGGRVMTVAGDGAVRTRRYWEPRADPAHLDRDEAYYIAAYRQVLSEAVACRLRRTVRPAGLLLGGGFDSGAIAGLAGPVVSAQRRKLVTVSSVMPEQDRKTPGNARKWVELLARHMKHLDVRYMTRENLDIFSDVDASYLQVEGLRGPNRYANDAMMKEIASAGVRVVMDGNGGDYTLNPRSRRALLRILLRGRVRDFVRELRAFHATTGVGYPRLILREIILPLLPDSIRGSINQARHGIAPFKPAMPVAKSFLRELREANISPTENRPMGLLEDRRISLRKMASRLQSGAATGGSAAVAAHGMELTLPYHDKRVVELALAIPESLMFKNGRDRYLARKALADVYPPEFQRRGSLNDNRNPDFSEMVLRVEPRILAEIDRMEKEGRLARFFDLPRMRRMLTGQESFLRNKRSDAAVAHAVRSFLHARYIEWEQRDNHPEI